MQQLSGLDASFVYLETPNAPMHVGSIGIYDQSSAPGGKVTFKGVLEAIERRLHLARSFRQKLAPVPLDLDHPYWVEDENFDLEFHVRHIALPQPGDWRQLCIQAARLHARPVDLSRPLWEVYVIEGLNHVEGVPEGSFAIVTKMHHSAVDGVSGIEMIGAIHDLAPDAEPPPAPAREWRPEAAPAPWRLLTRAGFNNMMRPMHFARVLNRSTPGMARVQDRLRRRELRLPAMTVPRTRFNGTVTAHRVIEGRRFDLDEVKRVKAAVPGATVNDVVLATVGGALRRYLQTKGELPASSLVTMAPISVRTEQEKGTAGNQVSAMFVPLGTDIADPLGRLTAVREATHQSKDFANAVGARALTEYSQFIPGGLAGLAARNYTRFGMATRTAPAINTVVTNVPGPQAPLYFAGARMVALYGMGPIQDGMGLIHPVTSYLGQIMIAITSCREMVPDPAFYSECIQGAFDELAEATS